MFQRPRYARGSTARQKRIPLRALSTGCYLMRASAFLAFNYVRLTYRGLTSLTLHEARHDRPLEVRKRGWTNADRGRSVIIQPELLPAALSLELTGMPVIRHPVSWPNLYGLSVRRKSIFLFISIDLENLEDGWIWTKDSLAFNFK